jgi:hypothetical protein
MADEEYEEFDLEFDWELTLETLVMVHYLNDRRWDLDGRLQFPSAQDIEIRAREMIEAIRDLGGGTYITLNGMKVYTDPEFPDSYEVYIKAGHASPRIPEGSK